MTTKGMSQSVFSFFFNNKRYEIEEVKQKQKFIYLFKPNNSVYKFKMPDSKEIQESIYNHFGNIGLVYWRNDNLYIHMEESVG